MTSNDFQHMSPALLRHCLSTARNANSIVVDAQFALLRSYVENRAKWEAFQPKEVRHLLGAIVEGPHSAYPMWRSRSLVDAYSEARECCAAMVIGIHTGDMHRVGLGNAPDGMWVDLGYTFHMAGYIRRACWELPRFVGTGTDEFNLPTPREMAQDMAGGAIAVAMYVYKQVTASLR